MLQLIFLQKENDLNSVVVRNSFFQKAVISISYLQIAPPVTHLSSLCATNDTSAAVKHIINA